MSVPDPASTDWVPLATIGGSGVDYKGAWSSAISYNAGDVVRHNGVDYLAVNPSTNQTPGASVSSPNIGTSLPASPINDQEYVLVDSLTAPTWAWRFRYVSSITDGYKWLAIGPVPLTKVSSNFETLTLTSSYQALATGPSITVPRTGYYIASFILPADGTPSVAFVGDAQLAVNGVSNGPGVYWSGPASTRIKANMKVESQPMLFSVGNVLGIVVKSANAGSWTFASEKSLSIIPVRVS